MHVYSKNRCRSLSNSQTPIITVKDVGNVNTVVNSFSFFTNDFCFFISITATTFCIFIYECGLNLIRFCEIGLNIEAYLIQEGQTRQYCVIQYMILAWLNLDRL